MWCNRLTCVCAPMGGRGARPNLTPRVARPHPPGSVVRGRSRSGFDSDLGGGGRSGDLSRGNSTDNLRSRSRSEIRRYSTRALYGAVFFCFSILSNDSTPVSPLLNTRLCGTFVFNLLLPLALALGVGTWRRAGARVFQRNRPQRAPRRRPSALARCLTPLTATNHSARFGRPCVCDGRVWEWGCCCRGFGMCGPVSCLVRAWLSRTYTPVILCLRAAPDSTGNGSRGIAVGAHAWVSQTMSLAVVDGDVKIRVVELSTK